RLVSPGEENWDVNQRQFPASFPSYDCQLARTLGLTYLVLGQPLDRLPALATPPASELLLSGPPIWIYRIPGAMPRVRMLDMSAAEAVQRGRRLLVEPPMAPADAHLSTASISESSPSTAKLASSVPGRVDLLTTSASVGLLLLNDLYYPG